MRIENLVQFIVPLTFLAIWALTSLFNREAQPLPPRMGRPQPPGGPGAKPSGTSTLVRSETLSRDPNQHWASPATSRRPMASTRGDDEILIIEETRRLVPTPSPARSGGGGSGAKRTNRARPASAAAKRTEPATTRLLSGAIGTSAGYQTLSQSLEQNPLSMPSSPLVASDPRELARSIAGPLQQVPPARLSPTPAAAEFRSMLETPSKLRDAFILNEILQPPLVQRHPRRI